MPYNEPSLFTFVARTTRNKLPPLGWFFLHSFPFVSDNNYEKPQSTSYIHRTNDRNLQYLGKTISDELKQR